MTSTGGREASPGPRRGQARDPILQSKITAPGVPGWIVRRPRLERRIAQGIQGPLTSVTGPPGAGKTLMIASWAADHGAGPVAWVTVDSYDNQPEVFWTYVVAALGHAGLDVRHAATSLARGGMAGHVFLLHVASALASHDPPVTLVLDDFHFLTDDAALAGLVYVLKNARPGLRLVVASRIDPPLPLHRYRLTGDLTEIRAGDLAFNASEVAALMAQHSVTLPPAALESLTEKGEGWAAGLRLAAMSMAGHPDPEQFVKKLSAEDSPVAGYLVEEVLNVQSADVRDLLLYASILERVNAGVASTLLDRGEVAGMLEALAKENAFVQPIADGWYRFHALFRDVLRLKLRREKPDLVASLHRKAARWCQQEDKLTEAVRYAAIAGDWPLVAAIMVDELSLAQLTGPGHGDLPTEGFRVIPEGDASPQFLLAAAAVALSESGDQAAEALLAAAENMLGQLPEDEAIGCQFGACTIRSSMAFRRGDLDALDDTTSAAERLLDTIPQAVLSRHQHAVAQVAAGRGAVELWSGNLGTAAGLLRRVAGMLEETIEGLDSGRPELQARRNELAACRGYLALAEALSGRLKSAEDIASSGTTLLGDGRRVRQPDPASALALAFVSLEHGEFSASRARLKVADAALEVHPDRLASVVGSLVAARGSLAEGRARTALETIERARRDRTLPPLLSRVLTLTELQAHAASGNGQAALDAARRAGPESAPDVRVALSRAWLAAGDAAASRRALAAVLETSAEGAERVRLEAWLADALVSFRGGDEARGRKSLEQALRLGEAEKRRLPFTVERSWLRPVLLRYPELAGKHRQLLGPGLAVPVAVPAPRHAPDDALPVIVEQLSRRERDVLRHVGEMLDTADIAEEMYISVNTVKTHLKSIFRKLGASDRREAVRRARQLNLLLPR